MAEVLDDGEFWLPPQFLTDDDVLMDFKAGGKSRGLVDTGPFYPEFPCGFGALGHGTDLRSPVESVVSSNETESDEEDFIAGLTRKMAHSTLQDDFWKSWPMATSPQSTLCSFLGGCGCKQGSPNCPSRLPSPPAGAAGGSRSHDAWDLLYAAAGEVARMKMIEEGGTKHFQQNRGLLLGPPRKPSPVSVPLKNHHNPNLGFPSNHSLSYHQLQVAQFQQLKQQQVIKQQGSAAWAQSKAGGHYQQQNQNHPQMVQNRARNGARPLGLSPSAWPTLQQSQQQQQQQQQPSSGMRAVFLGNNGSKRECAGTGVFLPRQIGGSTETRKKPGCSTVLLPDRVVQALNLNLEAMDAQSRVQSRFTGTLSPEYDAGLKYRNNALMAHQKRNMRPQPVMNQELRLPSEWTY